MVAQAQMVPVQQPTAEQQLLVKATQAAATVDSMSLIFQQAAVVERARLVVTHLLLLWLEQVAQGQVHIHLGLLQHQLEQVETMQAAAVVVCTSPTTAQQVAQAAAAQVVAQEHLEHLEQPIQAAAVVAGH